MDTEEQVALNQEQVEEKPEDFTEEIVGKSKKPYIKTEKRLKALEIARAKKSELSKLGHQKHAEILKESVKEIEKPVKHLKKIAEPVLYDDEDEEEDEVIQPVARVKKVVKVNPQPPQPVIPDDTDERLTEAEIRAYLRHKQKEEDEYMRVMMLKKQVEKEAQFKRGYASVFGSY